MTAPTTVSAREFRLVPALDYSRMKICVAGGGGVMGAPGLDVYRVKACPVEEKGCEERD